MNNRKSGDFESLTFNRAQTESIAPQPDIHLLFTDCGTCSRLIRIETAELSLKGTVGSYECFGHFKRKSSYKMSDNSLYLYDRMYDKKEGKNGWMVRIKVTELKKKI